MYKTEIDLDVARPLKQDALRFAHKDSMPALSSEQRPVACVASPVDSAVRSVGSRSTDAAGDIHNDSGVKVKTKSIGKISALITRFNGVESSVLDDKLPAKQFRIDLRNVLKSHETTREKSSDSRSGQGDEDISILGSQSSRLPVVQLNGKLYTETAKPDDVTLISNMSPGRKQLSVLKIPPKPSPKPKDTKKSISQTAVICPPNNEQSLGHCVTPSNLRLVTPFAINDASRTNNTGTVSKTIECENGRCIHIQAGVSASGSSQREHKLNQSQITNTASGTVLLPKDSRDSFIHRDDERLSKEQLREESLKGSITHSWQEGQQETTKMKPTVVPRHVGISQINHVVSTGKLLTSDVILESVVTLDKGTVSDTTKFGRTESKTAASSVSSDTSCHADVVKVTEDCKHLRTSNEKADVVISKEKAYDTIKNEKENRTKSNAAENFIKLDESRNENMTGNCIFVFDCNDPKTDSSVVGCKTTDPSVVGCKIATGPSFHDCSKCKETSVYECTASTDSGVFSCTTSTDSRLDGCETSTDTHGDECKISTEFSADGCSTSAELIIDEGETSVEPSAGVCTPAVSGSATSTGPIATSTGPSVTSSGPSATSTGPSVAECSLDDPSGGGDTITSKLDMLKSELMAMRKMDLVLLRQLININQAIQHIHRSDVPKVSRSLTFLSSRKNLQPHFRPVERQNSAPHCADRRRFLFSNVKWKTEDDYRDSLSSFDESEFDSSPSELEESTSSLNKATTSLPRSGANRRILFQARNIPLLPLDISEDSEQSYEDILQRNVRLWKMGFHRHQSVQERVDVWF